MLLIEKSFEQILYFNEKENKLKRTKEFSVLSQDAKTVSYETLNKSYESIQQSFERKRKCLKCCLKR